MSLIRPLTRSTTDRITADFFVGSYRLSASVVAHRYSVISVLNEKSDHLGLVDVYVSRINNPGDIVGTYSRGSLAKAKVDFIVLPPETASEIKGEAKAPNETELSIFITLPTFEVKGKLRWRGTLSVKNILTIDARRYLPILDATARNAFLPTVHFASPVLLINKDKIEFLCLNEEN